MKEQDFLALLEKVLFADAPLTFTESIPEHLYDSTGKLIIITTLSEKFNKTITSDDLINCKTPKDIYELIK